MVFDGVQQLSRRGKPEVTTCATTAMLTVLYQIHKVLTATTPGGIKVDCQVFYFSHCLPHHRNFSVNLSSEKNEKK
jgi:hypothetical protein